MIFSFLWKMDLLGMFIPEQGFQVVIVRIDQGHIYVGIFRIIAGGVF